MGSQKSILISLSKKHFTFYNNFHNNRARRTRAERNKSDELKKKNDDAFACFQTSCFTRVQHMRKIRYSLVFFCSLGAAVVIVAAFNTPNPLVRSHFCVICVQIWLRVRVRVDHIISIFYIYIVFLHVYCI